MIRFLFNKYNFFLLKIDFIYSLIIIFIAKINFCEDNYNENELYMRIKII